MGSQCVAAAAQGRVTLGLQVSVRQPASAVTRSWAGGLLASSHDDTASGQNSAGSVAADGCVWFRVQGDSEQVPPWHSSRGVFNAM
eukprot:1988119-Rhodomonas_salina.1